MNQTKEQYEVELKAKKERIISELSYKRETNNSISGSGCVGFMLTKITVWHKDFNIFITFGEHKSELKNFETAKLLYSLALDEILK